MTTLERGFKTWSERTSNLVRKELDVDVDDQLDLPRLAEYLGVRLWTPNDVPGMKASDLKKLLNSSWGEWYGMGLQNGNESIVIYNPKQSKRRQAADIAHELAHFLLEHDPAKLVLSEGKSLEQIWLRSYDQKQEDEANCLGWTLLVPREGLFRLYKRRMSQKEIADRFGVSEQLIRYRINSTGIRKQLKY